MIDWWLVFAVFLFFSAAALILAEVFVPSGGIISICALACLVGGIGIFFSHSNTAGWVGVIIAIVMIPTVIIIAYRIFPYTRFGKSVTLTPPDRQQGDAVPDTSNLKSLVGAEGTVISPLRPVGICDISGQRVECSAESGYVDKGAKIKVIKVESSQVTVRIIES